MKEMRDQSVAGREIKRSNEIPRIGRKKRPRTGEKDCENTRGRLIRLCRGRDGLLRVADQGIGNDHLTLRYKGPYVGHSVSVQKTDVDNTFFFPRVRNGCKIKILATRRQKHRSIMIVVLLDSRILFIRLYCISMRVRVCAFSSRYDGSSR